MKIRHPTEADAPTVVDLIRAEELDIVGEPEQTEQELRDEWSVLDLERDVWLIELDGRLAGCGALATHARPLAIGNVHPQFRGRGIGAQLVDLVEEEARDRGLPRLQIRVFAADERAHDLLHRRGYHEVRRYHRMMIELDAPPEPPALPDGLRFDDFDADRDARAFHAAQQEAFADHWEHRPRTFDEWRSYHLDDKRFEPALWCVVRDGDEIAAGAIDVAGLYGGGWVSVLFTRRQWRGRGVGGAVLQEAFRRLWSHGERSIGLGVDAGSDTGAFRLYERAGMHPVLGWLMHEKGLADAP